MKTTILKTIVATLLLAITTLSATEASANNTDPRRRQRHQTAAEANEQSDSTKTVEAPKTSKSIINGDEVIEENATQVDGSTLKPTRQNTPQQLDSVLALWKTSSTMEAYDNYFNNYLATTKRISNELNTTNIDSIYIARLEALMSPIPLEYNWEVKEAIERFTHPSYAKVMSLAYFYFPMIEEELIRAGLPIELRTLAVIESGLNPIATSKAGARGIWQFMPSTGKEFGLEINSLVDERCDPRLSTQAACRLFKTVYPMYNDWTLTLASYNTGPGNVNKAIVRAGGNPKSYKGSFWDVYEYLPEETRKYVPFYMGATYAFAYHKAHGVEVPAPPMPIAVDTIMIDRPMHLQQISSTINISLDLLKMLNPQYLMQIIPATSKKYALTLPVECICEYLEHEKEIHAKDSMYLKEYVIHANLEKKRKEVPQMQKSTTTTTKSSTAAAKYHTVEAGETLGAIAKKYSVTTKQLIEWNKLENPDALSIGQKLRVSATTTTTKSTTTTTTTKTGSTTKYHTVVEGDTLGAIAIKYNTNVKQLVEWNKLENPDALKLGQKLRVSK